MYKHSLFEFPITVISPANKTLNTIIVLFALNSLKLEFKIVMFFHNKPRIAVPILDL